MGALWEGAGGSPLPDWEIQAFKFWVFLVLKRGSLGTDRTRVLPRRVGASKDVFGHQTGASLRLKGP